MGILQDTNSPEEVQENAKWETPWHRFYKRAKSVLRPKTLSSDTQTKSVVLQLSLAFSGNNLCKQIAECGHY